MIKSVQNLTREGLTDKEFLVTAFEAVKHLGWRIRFVSDAGVIAYTNNGEHAWNGQITVMLEQDIAIVECVTISNVINDYGRSEDAVRQYIASFEKLRSALSDEEVRLKYMQYRKDFVPPYEDTLKPDIRANFHLLEGFLSYFTPAKGYFITPLLILLNIFIFLVMACTGVGVFDPGVQGMISWGANDTLSTLGGQWWRLVSSCFIHFGIVHLLLNMYALFYVGWLLEPFLGRSRFIAAYLLSGIIASLASVWWHDNTVSAGASGAIFGLYGVFLALLSTNHVERALRKGLLINIGAFVIYTIVYGSFQGVIDNAAHLGGLLSGILIGYAYIPAMQKPDDGRLAWRTLVLAAVITLICSAAAYSALVKSDRFTYQKRMHEFYDLETKAMSVLQEPGAEPDTLISGLQQGVAYWKQGIDLVKKADRLKLSGKLHKRNQMLIKYCQLRMQSFQLMANGGSGDSPQLMQVNQQLTSVMDQLSSK